MKKLLFIISACLIIVNMANAQNSNANTPSSLYDRLGGVDGITLIVDDVIDDHMKNPAISSTFLPYLEKPEQLAVIRQHTIDFFCAGSGGPQAYAGRDMPSTHQGMGITAIEYMAVMDDIMLVLGKHKIDQQSQSEVLMILWSLKGMIMGK